MTRERIGFHLEQTQTCLERAWQSRQSRSHAATRAALLRASDHLMQAARLSSGRLKRLRARKASQVLALTDHLPDTSRSSVEQEAVQEGDAGASWLIRERPHVRFDDVAGLDDVKHEINLKLVYPALHPEKARRFGIRAGGGMLLWGPPGTGKTLIARAMAGEIDAAFFSVMPSQIMSKWVGEAEQNIARLFHEARAAGTSVVFIDEVEALAPRRRSSGSTVMRRVVPQILAELEGFAGKPGTLLFVGATNEPWSIDPAMMRPGRFDAHIYVSLPALAARRRMLDIHLRDKPLACDVDLDRLAANLDGYSGADIAAVCERAAAIPFVESICEGKDRAIDAGDFTTVLSKVQPSVSAKELRRYEQFRVER